MATVSANATSVTQTSGTWTNPSNAIGADNATFASWVSTTRSATATLTGGGFGTWSTIPSNAIINSVTVRVKGYSSVTGAPISTITTQLFDGNTAQGIQQAVSLSSTTTNVYATYIVTGITLAQLQGNTLAIRHTATRTNSTTSATVFVDSYQLTVDYTIPDTVVTPPAGDSTADITVPTVPVVTTNLSNTCEGSDGTPVTTTNTAGPDQFSAVTTSGSGSITFSAAQAHSGTTSIALTTGTTSATTCYVDWSGNPDTSNMYFRAYLYLTAYPSVNARIFQFTNGGTSMGGATILTTGLIRLVNSANSTQATTTETIPLNQWVRFEVDLTNISGTTGDGAVRLFSGANLETATPDSGGSISAPGMTTGAPSGNDVRIGISSSVTETASWTVLIDDPAYSDVASPGPAIIPASVNITPPAGSALATSTAPVISGATPTYDGLVQSDGPVLYITNTASDISGHGHSVTANGSPSTTTMPNGDAAYVFDGTSQYLEVTDANDLSVPNTGVLTIEAWIRPDVLEFPVDESTGYVHWIGKHTSGEDEWAGRMYSFTTTDSPPRPNRISGYCFNLDGSLGNGSYFQDTVVAGQWIHYTLVINSTDTVGGTFPGGYTKIFKNGIQRDQDALDQSGTGGPVITPQSGTAPVRIATVDFVSYFQGAIGKIAIYNYELTPTQLQAHVAAMPLNVAPPAGSVSAAITAPVISATSAPVPVNVSPPAGSVSAAITAPAIDAVVTVIDYSGTGPAGTALTTTNTGATLTNIGSGASAVSTTTDAVGTSSFAGLYTVPASNVPALHRYTLRNGGGNQIAFSVIMDPQTAISTSSRGFLQLRDSATALSWSMRMTSTGTVQGLSATSQVLETTETFSPGTRIRVEVQANLDTSVLTYRIYNDVTGAALTSVYSKSAMNLGNPASTVEIGIASIGTTGSWSLITSNVRYKNSITEIGPLPSGTPASVSPPAGSASAAITNPAIVDGRVLAIPAGATTGAITNPALAVGKVLAIPTSSATANETAPALTIGVVIGIPAGASTSSIINPAISTRATIAVPSASTTAIETNPGIGAAVNIGIPSFSVTAGATSPSVVAGGAVSVGVPSAAVSAAITNPIVTSSVSIVMPPSGASATATSPVIAVATAVFTTIPSALTTASTTAPVVITGSSVSLAIPSAVSSAGITSPDVGAQVVIDMVSPDVDANTTIPVLIIGSNISVPGADALADITNPVIHAGIDPASRVDISVEVGTTRVGTVSIDVARLGVFVAASRNAVTNIDVGAARANDLTVEATRSDAPAIGSARGNDASVEPTRQSTSVGPTRNR